jgi:hypothetical protein
MANNSTSQQALDDIAALDDNDQNIEAKLQAIALAMAEAQGKTVSRSAAGTDGLIDPADAFACEGCQ